MTAPTSDFYLTLPSNASTSVYPKNGPSGIKVALPNVHELHGDEWQVRLASLIYPRTWVNIGGIVSKETVSVILCRETVSVKLCHG